MFLKLYQNAKDLLSIWFVPDQYKTQEMCSEAVQIDPEVLYALIILWLRNCGLKP